MDTLKPKGFLEVYKVYDDGTEELHFSENNVITSGMGVGLSHLFAASGGKRVSDFQVVNFQVGASGRDSNYGTSSYGLTGPLSKDQYLSTGSEVLVETMYPIKSGEIHASNFESFIRIPFSNIEKVSNTSVRFNLILDKFTATQLNNLKLSEVGLFMRNPRGNNNPNPILVAYRPFTGLKKTSTFALLFKWTINF